MAKKDCKGKDSQISNIVRNVDEHVAETNYHFWHICRENVIRIFGVYIAKMIHIIWAYMLQKKMKNFVWKGFAHKSLPSGNLSFLGLWLQYVDK